MCGMPSEEKLIPAGGRWMVNKCGHKTVDARKDHGAVSGQVTLCRPDQRIASASMDVWSSLSVFSIEHFAGGWFVC